MQYAAYVAASSVTQHMQPHPLANFFEAKLIKFEQIWLDLCKIKNLASPKNSISYDYAKVSFIPRQYSWDDMHEHEHRKQYATSPLWTISVKPVLCFTDFPLPSIRSICRCRSKVIMM